MAGALDQNGDLKWSMTRFPETHWGIVFEAGNEQSTGHVAALEFLCEQYWPPVYAYVRRCGSSPEEASDLAQGFFAFLIEHHTIDLADPMRGRFRSFLIASLRNFLSNQRRHEAAVIRGAKKPFVPWDDSTAERLYSSVLIETDTPERVFARRWAVDLLDRAHRKLRAEFQTLTKAQFLEVMEAHLSRESGAVPYDELATQLGLSGTALRSAVHRIRHRYRELIRAEIVATGVQTSEVDDEIRYLMGIMGG